MNNKRSFSFSMMVIVLLILLDQVTKYLAETFLSGNSGISVIPGVFQFYYLKNLGAAFGMMKNRQVIFILIALVMFAGVGYLLYRLPSERHYLPMRIVSILIMAGAAGNMIDRVVRHYVVDFLYFRLIDFPVFNIADCYVCIGAGLTFLFVFTIYRDEEFTFLK